MRKALFIIILISFSMHAYSEFAQPMANTLTFQIIHNELVLNNITVKSAEIVEERGVYRGLNIELTQGIAKVFTNMTKEGAGRKVNLVFNNNTIIASSILQTPLSGKFLISEISRKDAQAFLTSLQKSKGQF